MRILYLDVDSLRPDHLGCYGYHRATTPNIDRIAAEGTRFENSYVSDAPCLPSRTAMFGGRFGIHSGVVGHGGTAADAFVEGPGREFSSRLGNTSWMHCLRQAGLKTVTISSFGERHSAWHWYANFSEVYNPGFRGAEVASQVAPLALDWIERNGRSDNWFLHINFWDPHNAYRTPLEYGEPFAGEPIPAWLTEEVRQRHWQGLGIWSARDGANWRGPHPPPGNQQYPRQPDLLFSMDEVRRVFDGYDTGVRYADEHLGQLLNALAEQGVLEETAVIVTADHGESLGELNIYSDHHCADQSTARVPFILRWPGAGAWPPGHVDRGLHYQVDLAATVIELAGGAVPANWDGQSLATRRGPNEGGARDFLVLAQGAHTCQRSVRFEDYLCIRSYHDGYHDFPAVMLFDVHQDPHEQANLADERPEVVGRAMTLLDEWHGRMMQTATYPQDPMWTVLAEGGPHHTRLDLPAFLAYLRQTGRSEAAARLEAAHAQD
jgi:arylsulfatase A-like enzyme